MKIVLASDHAGFELKEKIKQYLIAERHEVFDKGTHSPERADYPDFAHLAAQSVLNKESEVGVIICGSGNGINMAANKHQGIRSAVCWIPEIAELAKQHNDANIIALPSRFIEVESSQAGLSLCLTKTSPFLYNLVKE